MFEKVGRRTAIEPFQKERRGGKKFVHIKT